MGKKKTKDPLKKAALQAKKEAKSDKAARKRLQKEAKQHQASSDANLDGGEEAALDDLLEVYRQKDLQVHSSVLEPLQEGFPLPRANATLTLCEDNKLGHVYLFGGEIYDGVENIVLDELLRWDVSKNEWKRLMTPMPRPGPRCAHTTVYYRNALYVLGGELATADQYHHYKDMWRLDLTSLKWEEIVPSRSTGTVPSARSGHVAFVWKHFMVVFGGFYEALRDTRWYNDVYVMDLQTLTWMDIPHSKLATRPEARSACNVGLFGDMSLIHGGFSKLPKSTVAPETKSKETKVHTDAWWLHLKPILQGKAPTWERISNRQFKSSAYLNNRSGTASATYKNRMIVYGGVVDTEQHHHRVDSVFFNDLFAFDMERRKWYPVRAKVESTGSGKSRRRRKKELDDDDDEVSETLEVKVMDLKREEEDEESTDSEEDEENENGQTEASGWDLDMLRSNMFAFIDGEGNIVYEKMHDDEKDGYGADSGGRENIVGNKGDSEEEEDEEKEEEKEETKEETDMSTDDAGAAAIGASARVVTADDHNHHAVPSSAVLALNEETDTPEAVARSEPLPRINSTLVVRNNVLYVYGGLIEVGDREVTLDDCWAFDLRKRNKWECLWEGTMHRQVWRGAAVDDDDSYVSTEQGGDEELGSDASNDEFDPAAKSAKNTSTKQKGKRAGLRQEITELKLKLDLDDPHRTPQAGEVMADFYSRTAEYWNVQASQRFAENSSRMSETEKPSSKEMKREGFSLAKSRYDELLPVLERLNELDLQQKEAEEARKVRKAEKAKTETRRTNRRSR